MTPHKYLRLSGCHSSICGFDSTGAPRPGRWLVHADGTCLYAAWSLIPLCSGHCSGSPG
ncbi:hypothetical protein GIB67_023915, partial [Kingdonia uniflora]